MFYATVIHESWPGRCKTFSANSETEVRKAAKAWILDRTKDEKASYIEGIDENATDDSWLDVCFDEDWELWIDDGEDPATGPAIEIRASEG